MRALYGSTDIQYSGCSSPSIQAPTPIGCEFLKSERQRALVKLVAGRGFEPLTFGL